MSDLFDIIGRVLQRGYRLEFEPDEDDVTVRVLTSYNAVEAEEQFSLDDEEGVENFLGRFY